ncbi:MAG: NusG domain II-containing protein [Bacteroidota bacterium]|nr:NusG domain II-containing protein [Bacteroidota bacterium]
MDRRRFFITSLSGLRDAVIKSAQAVVPSAVRSTVLDLTIITGQPSAAEALVHDLLGPFFGNGIIRLKSSMLEGYFPGGLVLYENNVRRDHKRGISRFDRVLNEIERRLDLGAPQRDPLVLRFANSLPPSAACVLVSHRDRVLLSLPLTDDGTFDIEGDRGVMRLAVRSRRFSIVESRCPHRICTAHPAIGAAGQRLICLPNDVTAVIGALGG